MESSWLLLALVSALAISLISKMFKTQPRPEQKLRPPGPKPWPIIGNLNLVGSLPHQSLHHLSQKYGEIMLLKFGKFPVVVASSPEMAKQFLKVHDAVFASRPALAAGKHISYNYSDVSFAPYGPYWREARKIFLSEVLNAKKLETSEHIRVEENRRFLLRLLGKPVVLRDHLSRYTLSTICRMLFRDELFSESKLREMMREWFLLSGAFNIGDWIPWLNFLDLQGYVKRMKSLRAKMDCFYDTLIDDHLATRAAAQKDFVDVLLQIVDDPDAQVELTRDCVKALTMNLVLGGTDTSAATIEWALHEVMRQPHIVERAKEELNTVIGRERWVEENDLAQLPYIDAIIMESFRLHPIATLLAPRYATDECEVAGYNISKGTTVLINAWSIGRHPNSWDTPQAFLPDRFMGTKMDMMNGRHFALLPFGSGRRGCPGYDLGLKIVRLTLANLLHGFQLKFDDPQGICLEEEYGLSTHPKHPLTIIFTPTLPTHLY